MCLKPRSSREARPTYHDYFLRAHSQKRKVVEKLPEQRIDDITLEKGSKKSEKKRFATQTGQKRKNGPRLRVEGKKKRGKRKRTAASRGGSVQGSNRTSGERPQNKDHERGSYYAGIRA